MRALRVVLLLLGLMSLVSGRQERRDVNDSLDQLMSKVENLATSNTKVAKIKTQVSRGVSRLRKNVDDIDPDTLNAISGAFASASGAFEKFTSDNPQEIVSGVLDMVSSFAPLLGQAGPVGMAIGTAVSAISSVVSGILGLFGGGASMDDVVRDVIEQALEQERNRELLNRVEGVKDVFETSQAFIDGIRDRNAALSSHEIAALAANVPVYQGVEFMGILASEMSHNCRPVYDIDAPPSDLLDKARTCLRFSALYAQLAILQDLVLLDLYTTIEETGHSPSIAAGVMSVKDSRLHLAGDKLEFLHSPEVQEAVPASLYRQSVSVELENFLSYCGVQPMENQYWMEGAVRALRPQSWEHWYAYLQSGASKDTDLSDIYPVRGWESSEADPQGRFVFQRVEGHNWAFHTELWPDWYIFMNDAKTGFLEGIQDLHCNNDCALFTFIKIKNSDYYLIASKKWPDWFVYMNDGGKGYVRGWHGNPGEQGWWRLSPY